MESYPKWKYHKTKEAVIVNNEAEEKKLGAGWEESPADLEEEADKKESKKNK